MWTKGNASQSEHEVFNSEEGFDCREEDKTVFYQTLEHFREINVKTVFIAEVLLGNSITKTELNPIVYDSIVDSQSQTVTTCSNPRSLPLYYVTFK